MAGWGGFFGKIADQFQGRVERLKNERTKLEKELKEIEDRDCTPEKAKRAGQIIKRLDEISAILQNKASD